MGMRLVAFVKAAPAGRSRPVAHYWLRPNEERVGELERRDMAWPRVLALDETPGGTFLYRYGADGAFAGDTWHESLEEAKAQAAYEFGDLLGEWRAVPSGEEDLEAHVLRELANRQAN